DDLLAGLRDRRRGVDAEDGSGAILRREARDHTRLGRAGDRADDDRVEEAAELALLVGDLVRPAGEPEPAERMVGRAGRDRVRLPAARLDRSQRLLPARPDA